jgi:hypothetical protein
MGSNYYTATAGLSGNWSGPHVGIPDIRLGMRFDAEIIVSKRTMLQMLLKSN